MLSAEEMRRRWSSTPGRRSRLRDFTRQRGVLLQGSERPRRSAQRKRRHPGENHSILQGLNSTAMFLKNNNDSRLVQFPLQCAISDRVARHRALDVGVCDNSSASMLNNCDLEMAHANSDSQDILSPILQSHSVKEKYEAMKEVLEHKFASGEIPRSSPVQDEWIEVHGTPATTISYPERALPAIGTPRQERCNLEWKNESPRILPIDERITSFTTVTLVRDAWIFSRDRDSSLDDFTRGFAPNARNTAIKGHSKPLKSKLSLERTESSRPKHNKDIFVAIEPQRLRRKLHMPIYTSQNEPCM